MEEKDLYWLAGLLEGEGSFLKPAPSEPKLPRIVIHMTDKDIILRVAALFGVRYVYARQDSRGSHWKESYSVRVKGSKAIQLMKLLYPLMGKRRKGQVEAAIGERPVLDQISFETASFFWIAGLLEGEGSFMKGPPSDPNNPRIHIQMADRDVLEKVATIFDTKVKGPYRPSDDRDYFKSRYVVAKKGKQAVELMRQLRPLMGQRRQAQIVAALESYIPNRDHGDNHPQAKLTAEKVREVKRRLAQGEKLTHLAREYKVDTGLIWQIKAGRIWHHVPP